MNKTNKKILCVIPARSGSKGIKNKNVKLFCGKPLMYYSIKQALASPFIDRVIVSTDSQQYADIAKKYGADVPFLRPTKFAGDKSPDMDTFIHLLKKLKEDEGYVPDYVIKLHVTSPLRTTEDIDNCIGMALNNNCDGVVSLCPTEQLLYTTKNGFMKLLYKKGWVNSTNRQSLPATYRLNAAFYMIKTNSLLSRKSFLKGRILAYVMPKYLSVDLDGKDDFILAEMIYKNRQKILNKLKK